MEKNVSNPLRKKSLEGLPNNKEILDDKLSNVQLSPEEDQKLKNLQDAKVDPEFINKFRQSKIQSISDRLNQTYLRDKIDSSRYQKILMFYGIQVYQDTRLMTFDLSQDFSKIRILKYSLSKMISDLRGLTPVRRPRIVITDIGKDPNGSNMYRTGEVDTPPAYYKDRIIFIDINHIDESTYFTHEYAHYIVDLIPKQTEPLLISEYEKLLDNYFTSIKQRKRKNLEANSDDPDGVGEASKWRQRISKKLGFPSEYGLTNFDEFWAEIITHWNSIPNNKQTYQFKQIAKKIMTRLN